MPLELDQQIPRGDERAIGEPTPLYSESGKPSSAQTSKM